LSTGGNANATHEGSSLSHAANTTGKKRTRSSSSIPVNNDAQSEATKRVCITDIHQAYTEFSESVRTLKMPALTAEQQVLINNQYNQANTPSGSDTVKKVSYRSVSTITQTFSY
jgi:hypothetical protein